MALAHAGRERGMHEGQEENAMISGHKSEQSVVNHIRMLYALQDRTKEADDFMYKLAQDYLTSSADNVTARRRAHDLLRIAAGTI